MSSAGFSESCTWEIEESSQPTLTRRHLTVLTAQISVGIASSHISPLICSLYLPKPIKIESKTNGHVVISKTLLVRHEQLYIYAPIFF